MHAISSYRGNRPTNKPTNKHTHTETGPITIYCADKLSAQCNNSFRRLLRQRQHTIEHKQVGHTQIYSHNTRKNQKKTIKTKHIISSVFVSYLTHPFASGSLLRWRTGTVLQTHTGVSGERNHVTCMMSLVTHVRP